MKQNIFFLFFFSAFLLVLAQSCKDDDNLNDDLVAQFSLETLPDIPYPPDNPFMQERVDLGQLIFYDPILGGEKNSSCAACHHPEFAFADGRQFGAGTSGVGLGPDRMLSVSNITGLPIDEEPRNSPTVFNTAFNLDANGNLTHLGFQFLDGRVEGLEVQATKPIGSRVEMRGDAYEEEAALDTVIARLRAIPEYVQLFETAFPDETPGQGIINEDTYGRAIAAFERELVTRNSPYDRFVNGEKDALSDAQINGLKLFFGKAKCSSCHNGPMFNDYKFTINGVPQEGGGKAVIPGDDTGREEHTGDPADRYAFRNLTLRNIELTAPYMHDGVFKTLKEVVQFYNNGCQPRHPQISDSMMDPALTTPLNLTDGEIDDLVAFIKALTDNGSLLPQKLMSVPDRVPSGLTPVFGN
ncbi:MAG TPA: c-type cytochrome [Bacteroidetes bacterium]|nr:c-type cytochrome [Bacteroidota bacterium]